MYNLTIIQKNGGNYIDSREVAEAIGKQHGHLMRDIRGYVKIMENAVEKIIQSNFGVNDFFLESSYVDSIGRTLPCYLLSKIGCEVVANKLIGEKGVLFTVAYVREFNRMEADERARLENECAELEAERVGLEAQLLEVSAMPAPRLGEYNACSRIVVRALRDMGAASGQIVNFLKGVYEPLGIAVAGDFDDAPQMYTAKQIAKKLGIYSMSGNPHYLAVSCILNENIFIDDSHKIVTTHDYGNHIGIFVRYDDYAIMSVMRWLMANKFPDAIFGFERTYRVLYRA